MKTSLMSKLVLTAFALGTATSLVVAQEERPPREGGRPPGGQGGPGGPGGPGGQGGQRGPGGPGGPGGPRMMPIIAALDANNDGEIDATEIANASAALKKLDKNGDGKLTPDEFRGQRPGGPGGQGGPGGPGGPGGQRGGNEGGGQRRRPQPE